MTTVGLEDATRWHHDEIHVGHPPDPDLAASTRARHGGTRYPCKKCGRLCYPCFAQHTDEATGLLEGPADPPTGK